MIAVQGTTGNTKLRHTLRTVRASYLENVRAKRCALDTRMLAKLDNSLKVLDDTAKTQARARKR